MHIWVASVSWLPWCVVLVAQSCLTLCDPTDCSSPGSSVHEISPGKNTGVGCHSLLQRIFLTQGSNPGFLHCRQILYHLNYREDPTPKKGSAKECSNYRTMALISHASKIMFKILQARLQQYMNWEYPDIQAGFRTGRGTRDQIANIRWITEKSR